jgi:hypothetical protein
MFLYFKEIDKGETLYIISVKSNSLDSKKIKKTKVNLNISHILLKYLMFFIPAKPKKCWGKKVVFTPTNNVQKWIFPNNSLYDLPIILGAQ